MSFLSPWFLVGLLALALPLWLHRLQQRSADKRVWSSLALFRHSVETSVRRRRLRYLALLAARLLVLALLALFFARPRLDAGLPLAAPTPRHVIAIDTSMSMGHGGTWEQVTLRVTALLRGLPGAHRSQLVAFGPGVRILGGPTGNHGEWRKALADLEPTAGRASYGELGEALRALAQDDPAPMTVSVISDFQRTGAPDRFADLGLPPGARLLAEDVAAPAPRPNWCVESVRGGLRVHGNQRAELQVTIAGFETPAVTKHIELHVGGKRMAAAEASLPASGRATVHFADIEVPRGYRRAEVRLSPGDELPADDVSYLVFERTDSLPVLLVRLAGDARGELYYRAALAAAGGGTFDLEAATPSEAETRALDRFAFVVVHDVARLPALLETRLRAFLEAGRSVLLVLGPAAARERKAPWIASAPVDSGRAERALHGAVQQPAHPALAAAETLPEVRIHRHVRVAADPDRVLVRLGDGSPLLFEQPMGAGRLLVLTSPFDAEWNDWPVHVSFVPFTAASARWLAGVDRTRRRATVGDVLDLGAGAGSVQVIDPQGQRALSLAESVSARAVRLARAGFYEIRRQGREELVAVNPDARESDLRRMDPDVLARWQATAGPTQARAGAAATVPPRDVSHRVLWILLAVALVESTLANRYLRGPA